MDFHEQFRKMPLILPKMGRMSGILQLYRTEECASIDARLPAQIHGTAGAGDSDGI